MHACNEYGLGLNSRDIFPTLRHSRYYEMNRLEIRVLRK